MNKTNQKQQKCVVVAVTALLLSLPYAAHATDYTWSGKAGDGQWASANNWVPRGVPGAHDSVTIGGHAAVQVTGRVSLKNLRLGRAAALVNDGALSVSGRASSDGLVMGGGDLTIPAGASATINLGAANSRQALSAPALASKDQKAKKIKFGKITNKGTLRVNVASSVDVELGDVANLGGEAVLNFADASAPVQLDALKNEKGTLTLIGAGARGRAVESQTVANNGKMVLAGARLVTEEEIFNAAGATLTLTDGSVVGDGDKKQTLENAGLLEVTEGGAEIQMEWRNKGGRLRVDTGHLTIAPPAGKKAVQESGITTLDGGTLEIVDSTRKDAVGELQIQGGVLDGSGTIEGNVAVDAGAVNIGHSPGLMIINGNFSLTINSLLNMEIWGPAPGTQYDQLRVSGNSYLDGTFNVIYGNNYAPGQSSFLHISYGFYIGRFASVNYYNTTPGKYYRVIYSGTAFYSQVLSSPPPGSVQSAPASPSFSSVNYQSAAPRQLVRGF